MKEYETIIIFYLALIFVMFHFILGENYDKRRSFAESKRVL